MFDHVAAVNELVVEVDLFSFHNLSKMQDLADEIIPDEVSVVHNLKAKAGQGPEERDEVERQSAAEEEAVDDNLEAAVEVVDNWEELPKIVIGVVIVVGGGVNLMEEAAVTDVKAGDIEFYMLTSLHPKGLDLNQHLIEFLDRDGEEPSLLAEVPCFVESVQWQMKDKIVS